MYVFNVDCIGPNIKTELNDIELIMLITNVKNDHVIEFQTGIIGCKAALSEDFTSR